MFRFLVSRNEEQKICPSFLIMIEFWKYWTHLALVIDLSVMLQTRI